MSVRQLLQSMDAAELTEWRAFYMLEPWGTDIEDRRSAMMTAAAYNGPCLAMTGKTVCDARDFLPDYDQEPQSLEMQRAILTMLTGKEGTPGEHRNTDSDDNG